VDHDYVYVGSAAREHLVVLDRATGRPAWSHAVRKAVAGSPRLYGSDIWFGSDDFHVYGLDSLSHEQVSSFQTNGIVRAAPAVDGKNVYVGSSDGFLYCYYTGERGKIRWRRPLGEGGEVFSEALVRGSRVYVGSTNGYLFALERSSGEIVWAFRTGGPVLSRPVAKGRLLYVTSMDGHIYAIRDDY
jgi:outer membrane protein assembly factor BamB